MRLGSYITILFFISALIGHFLYSFYRLRRYLHSLQLNSYYNSRYWSWLINKKNSIFCLKDLEPAIALLGILFSKPVIVLILGSTIYFKLFLEYPHRVEKKPLVFTPRALRVLIVNLVLLLILYYYLLDLLLSNKTFWFSLSIGVLGIYNLAQPFLLGLVNWILSPLEYGIGVYYLKDGHRWVKKLNNLTVIGITGSFGKTSTKYIVTELLKTKFNTIKTPESYNTPMGVTKIIRSSLKSIHDIFVVEMSAKQSGDIKKLCNLVIPKYGIITAIGDQHLDTFGNIDTIQKTKGELAESLPADGVLIINNDNPYCRNLISKAKCKVMTYGVDNDSVYQVRNISIYEQGSKFTVVTKQMQKASVDFETKLLGKHNIYNILGSIAMAAELGVPIEQMVYQVKQLDPIPHRLELKKIAEDIFFIDNAFNSNPLGSEESLKVLDKLCGKRKIIVTPGMIELGSQSQKYNLKFGQQIARVCDYVILVGKQQTLPMQQGLEEQNFSRDKIFIAHDFAEAYNHLRKILRPGDSVLFENDLPDIYNET